MYKVCKILGKINQKCVCVCVCSLTKLLVNRVDSQYYPSKRRLTASLSEPQWLQTFAYMQTHLYASILRPEVHGHMVSSFFTLNFIPLSQGLSVNLEPWCTQQAVSGHRGAVV